MNDESTKAGAPVRGGRAYPKTAPGPSDPSVGPSLGLPDGQVLEEPEEDKWQEFTCVLCHREGKRYEGSLSKSAFNAHLRQEHFRKSRSIREGQQRRPCITHCVWVCSVCGRESYYPTDGRTHGGPVQRLIDKRFALGECIGARYPSHKRQFGKIDGAAGPVVKYHQGLTFSPQPIQDDESLKEFLDEKAVPKSTKRGGRKPGGSRDKPKVWRTAPTNRVLERGERQVRGRRAVPPATGVGE